MHLLHAIDIHIEATPFWLLQIADGEAARRGVDARRSHGPLLLPFEGDAKESVAAISCKYAVIEVTTLGIKVQIRLRRDPLLEVPFEGLAERHEAAPAIAETGTVRSPIVYAVSLKSRP